MADLKPILLVEDDDVDVMAVKRVLRELNIRNELAHAANGEEALAYLRRQDGAPPCVILLDLNMPKMNGLELLRIVKADEALKDIPVVVVTTSNESQDMATSLELGAAAYISKSPDYQEFRDCMKAIKPYSISVRQPRLEPIWPV